MIAGAMLCVTQGLKADPLAVSLLSCAHDRDMGPVSLMTATLPAAGLISSRLAPLEYGQLRAAKDSRWNAEREWAQTSYLVSSFAQADRLFVSCP
jgi:hypothetical protein